MLFKLKLVRKENKKKENLFNFVNEFELKSLKSFFSA